MNCRTSSRLDGMSGVTKILAVMGAAAVLVVVAGAIGLAFTVRAGFSAREQPSTLETVLARTVRSWSIPARARRLQNPAQGSADVLAEAMAHWADHCAICHANNGSGDTTIGRGLYPKAPDMRAKPERGRAVLHHRKRGSSDWYARLGSWRRRRSGQLEAGCLHPSFAWAHAAGGDGDGEDQSEGTPKSSGRERGRGFPQGQGNRTIIRSSPSSALKEEP